MSYPHCFVKLRLKNKSKNRIKEFVIMMKGLTFGEKIFLEVHKYDAYEMLKKENVCIKKMDIKIPSEWFNDMSDLFLSDSSVIDKIFELAANSVMSLDELVFSIEGDFGHNNETYKYILTKINLSLKYFSNYIKDKNNTDEIKRNICVNGLKVLRMGNKEEIMNFIK
jgi:hypothetical protein